MKNPFLVGPKVYLRPLDRADAPALVPWFNDPEVLRTVSRHRPMSLQEEESWLEGVHGNEHGLILGIVTRAADQLIGVTGLHQMDFKNRTTAFGITIGEKEQWGKGYGTEATGLVIRYAFDTLNLNRVWLYVYEFNERGIRAYEKVGFRREGVLRQDCYREGKYWNTLVMGILREEWEAVQY